MGMVVAPAQSGIPAGTVLVGNNVARAFNESATAGFQLGSAYTAVLSGTANNLNVLTSGGSASPTTPFRLCIWSAATLTTGWTLLGYTADQTGLPLDTLLTVPLITPVLVVAGDLYALTIQCDSPGGATASGAAGQDRFASDAFSDGPVGSISSTGNNGVPARVIYATT